MKCKADTAVVADQQEAEEQLPENVCVFGKTFVCLCSTVREGPEGLIWLKIEWFMGGREDIKIILFMET